MRSLAVTILALTLLTVTASCGPPPLEDLARTSVERYLALDPDSDCATYEPVAERSRGARLRFVVVKASGCDYRSPHTGRPFPVRFFQVDLVQQVGGWEAVRVSNVPAQAQHRDEDEAEFQYLPGWRRWMPTGSG